MCTYVYIRKDSIHSDVCGQLKPDLILPTLCTRDISI